MKVRGIANRLMALIEYDTNGGCWLWSAITQRGYGFLKIRGSRKAAHRLSWSLHRGAIPAGLCVLHRCDTPACINPDHLFLGTQADNMADMAKKGRSNPSRWNARLSPKAAIAIRQSALPAATLAAEYGVRPKTIKNVRRGKSYAWV